jgi:pilus assembly protein FimV
MTILNKEKILEVAKAFIDEGKLDKAIREYEKILLADPTDLKVKLRVAELYTKRKQIGEAIRIYKEVAESYTSEGFLLKAVTVYKNILRLNPSLIEVNEELAQLYERMGLINDAVRQYDILASTLDMRGMGERVVEVRRKIVSMNPNDGSARIKLAELLQREGSIEDSIDEYVQYAAQVEQEGGSKAKLADLYEKILAYRPENHDLVRKLIDIYEELSEHKKALKWLEADKELVENDTRLLRLAAMIYTSQNQHETARMKYMQIADLETKAGNADAALEAYFEILVTLPEEEDRLYKRVEEIKPGAMDDLLRRSIERRKELEEEEIRRQAEEETGEGEMPAEEEEPPATPAKPATQEKEEPAPKAEPQAEAPKVAAPPPVAPPVPPPPKPKVDKAQGDRAFELGTTYHKMGLKSEAERELKKAQEIYSAYLEGGGDEPSVAERMSKIEASLAGVPKDEGRGAKDAKPKETAKPVKQAKPAKKAEDKPTKPKAEEKKEPSKKKRISFV